ncbi:MAG: L-2-hydroxyglutarate oxidase [Verrucomicrobia bacterium]|nr:L-2-hydroxyglutarate oxidase [Verrucomicrobiota bacterium]
MKRHDFLVIGGGIVGLAVAREILLRKPGAAVCALEKEDGPGRHQSTHNSGVLHCGLYYKPGSLKARLAVGGIRLMTRFCAEQGIAHEICGKVVVAADENEVVRLRDLQERGIQNGLEGLEWLDAERLREIEPHAAGVAALRVPQEGIVDYGGVCEALVREIERLGGTFQKNARVFAIQDNLGGWVLETTAGEFEGDYLVNCAGLFSDRIAKLAGAPSDIRIVPFRGEYFQLAAGARHLVRHLIYPVPDPAFPFLGVHFTRLIHGGIEAGPNAVLALAREGYRKTDIHPLEAAETLAFPGLWNFLRRYPLMVWDEGKRSLSKKLFAESLQKLVPEIREEHLAPGGAGVRAQAMTRDGQLVQDFCLLQKPRALHVVNAPSPAATASLAIAEEIVGRIGLRGL